MTFPLIIARNSQALTKVCLGGGFVYGFAYTNSHGTSPLGDAAKAAGMDSPNQHTTLTFRTSRNV
jgi:hypothetical protein